MALPGAMEAFQLGQAGGIANSPVTGIGIAIKRVVDDAQKKGLLRAQSQFQGEATNQTNILKEGRAETALGMPKSTQIVSPTTGDVINTVEGTRGGDVKVAPAENPLNAFISKLAESMIPTTPAAETPAVTPAVKSTGGGGVLDNIIPNRVQPAVTAPPQEGDEEIITVRFPNGTTQEMTVGQARALQEQARQ